MKPCSPKCNWNLCMGYPHFWPSEIFYCRFQIVWLVDTFVTYSCGKLEVNIPKWPPEDKEGSGYIDLTNVQLSPSSSAPYERMRGITGDLLSRLSKTGKDGQILVLEAHNNVLEFSQDAKNALNYCSGWRQKKLSYQRWLITRRYRNKKGVRNG